jgi:hypothetical protein
MERDLLEMNENQVVEDAEAIKELPTLTECAATADDGLE